MKSIKNIKKIVVMFIIINLALLTLFWSNVVASVEQRHNQNAIAVNVTNKLYQVNFVDERKQVNSVTSTSFGLKDRHNQNKITVNVTNKLYQVNFLDERKQVNSVTSTSSGLKDRHNQNPIRVNVTNKLCQVNFVDERKQVNNKTDLKMIYYVTPTYPRPEQTPELTRLAHTLMHVPRIHWIVADDQINCSGQVLSILRKTGLPFTYISSPNSYITKSKNKPRGVSNRRAALKWLHDNVQEGILYMGDDDNTVDLEFFNEIRQTIKVSMFPVGLIGNYGVSSPIVKDGKVVGFFDSWPGLRIFPVDMAGFAINIKFLKPNATMPYWEGHEEDRFLFSLGLKMDDIEPLAHNCTKVLVWHTKTHKIKTPTLKLNLERLYRREKFVNLVALLKEVTSMGMAHVDPIKGSNVIVIRKNSILEPLSDLK